MVQETVVDCALQGCGGRHPVRLSRNRRRTPFYKCSNYGSGTTVFLDGPIGSSFLENGGAVIENPSSAREIPESIEVPDRQMDVASGEPDSPVYIGTCSGCGSSLTSEAIGHECWNCHEPVEHVVDAPASNAEGLASSSIAGHCANGHSLTYADLNRGICPGCNEPLNFNEEENES